MPAQERIGLNNQQRLPPGTNAVGEEHQSYAVGRSAAGAFHAPPEDQELLAQQRVLRDQLGLAADEISECPGEGRCCGGFRHRHEATAESVEGGVTAADDTTQELSEHEGPWQARPVPRHGATTSAIIHHRSCGWANQPVQAYFFAVLAQLLAARGLIRPARDPPPPGEAAAPTPGVEGGMPCVD